MNQKKIFLTLATFSCFCASLLAQSNNFDPSHSKTWNSPATNYGNQHSRPVTPALDLNTNASFPKSPVAFDASIRTASYEMDRGNASDGSNGSLEASIDSAAESLSKWKDDISKKSSQLLGSMKEGSWPEKLKSFFGGADVGRMLGSLSLVLGGYFALVWVLRRFNLGGNKQLPSEVLEVVGHAPFGPKQNLQLVRLGSKLLLLMNSPEGTQPIGEITDPVEVDHLVALCSGKPRTLSRPSPAITHVPSPPPREPNTTSLNDVLRALDSAKASGTLFEA